MNGLCFCLLFSFTRVDALRLSDNPSTKTRFSRDFAFQSPHASAYIRVQRHPTHENKTVRLQHDGQMSLENHVCAGMNGIEQEFCFSVLGTQSKATMTNYKLLRNECNWVPFRGYFTSKVSVPGTAASFASAHRAYLNYNDTLAKMCKKLLLDEEFRIFRLGPFVSDGNNDKWYQFAMEDLMPDLNGEEMGLRGYLQGAVDADGELLGYPPLQLHHHHFTDLQCDQIADVVGFKTHSYSDDIQMRMFTRPTGFPIWADTHTDKQCSEEMGGTTCLIRLWPQRFSMPMKLQRSGCLFGDYMDVREPNSPQLTWWMEAMMHITPHIQQYLGMFTLGHTRWFDFSHPHPRQFINQSWTLAEYTVDVRKETVVWSSVTAPYNGRVVLALKHTHRLMTEDFFVVRGTPDMLGLPEMYFLNHSTWVQRDVSPSLVEHKQKIYERIRALEEKNLAELVCAMHDQVNSLELVNGSLIDRMLPLPCAGWQFHENETFTFISFHKAQKGILLPMGHNIITMHSLIYVYAIPEMMSQDPFDVMVGIEGVVNEDRQNSRLAQIFHDQSDPSSIF